jgi:hypothetical protein
MPVMSKKTKKIEFKTNDRVPPSTFNGFLRILATAANVAFATPKEAERAAEDAYQKVTGGLPERHHEETDDSNEKSHKFARLRMKFDRSNLKLLRESLYPQTSSPAPIGPAVLTLVRTTDMVIKELDAAYRLAPRLDDERSNELPSVEIPDSSPNLEPGSVDYDSMLT